jgi:ribulose-5-phosphate 4-epimerase/fuculose-1-phosphate aldolase
MHIAVYRRRADVTAIARGHPRHVAAFACAAEPLRVAHGLGANLGATVPAFPEPFLIASAEIAERVADVLGDAQAVILQANGMLAVGQSIPHACVRALLLEETAELQALARAAGLSPRLLSPEEVVRSGPRAHSRLGVLRGGRGRQNEGGLKGWRCPYTAGGTCIACFRPPHVMTSPEISTA